MLLVLLMLAVVTLLKDEAPVASCKTSVLGEGAEVAALTVVVVLLNVVQSVERRAPVVEAEAVLRLSCWLVRVRPFVEASSVIGLWLPWLILKELVLGGVIIAKPAFAGALNAQLCSVLAIWAYPVLMLASLITKPLPLAELAAPPLLSVIEVLVMSVFVVLIYVKVLAILTVSPMPPRLIVVTPVPVSTFTTCVVELVPMLIVVALLAPTFKICFSVVVSRSE
jgi:hypothetical protein